MAPQFKVFVSIRPYEIVFKCKGRLDVSAACEILRRLEECYNTGQRMVIDLERVDDLDPLGMRTLKSALNGRHRKLGRKVELINRKEENLWAKERFGN